MRQREDGGKIGVSGRRHGIAISVTRTFKLS
jgi:hypothetical protein